jgi:hypothetical protein
MAGQVHGQSDDAVCALESVEGAAQTFAGVAGMSAHERCQWAVNMGEKSMFGV